MLDLSLSISGAREADLYLGEVDAGLDDLAQLHEQFVIIIQAHIQRHWPTSPALAPLTIAARPRGGTRPLVDTGKLWRSVTGDDGAEATGRWARIVVEHPGAAVHQYGATIRPRRRKFLAIPMSPEASKSDGPRSFPRELQLIPLRRKPGFLMVEKPRKQGGSRRRRARSTGGRERQTKAHFLLTKEARIPPRPYFPEIEAVMPAIEDATDRYLAALQEGRGR